VAVISAADPGGTTVGLISAVDPGGAATVALTAKMDVVEAKPLIGESSNVDAACSVSMVSASE
jgi:hypothetical protein